MIMDDIEVITVKMIPRIVKRTMPSEERLKKEMNFANRIFGFACFLCGCLVGAMVVYIVFDVMRNI